MNFLGEVARAAAAGELPWTVIELGAQGLLGIGQGDRAGVWLAPFAAFDSGSPWRGIVVELPAESSPGPHVRATQRIPAEWHWLDLSTGFLRAVVQGDGATLSGVGNAVGIRLVPQLEGMRSVVWLPLRVRGRAVGLAMVAYRQAQEPVELAGLEALTSELALAAAEASARAALDETPWERQPFEGFPAPSNEPLERIEAELSTVLAGIDAGALLIDHEGRIRVANTRLGELLELNEARQSALRTFGDLAFALAGRLRHPESFRPPAEEVVAAGEAATPDRPARREIELAGSEVRMLERSIFPVRGRAGRSLGWLELYRDVTSQRLLPSKLLQTEKMAAIGQLVSGIAHELNNPLTGILGYAQLLLGRGLGPSQQAEAQRIYEEAERASHIVKNLLLFARETQPERLPVDLNEVVERALALRSYELKVEDIEVLRELDSRLPETRADPIQLQQVVLNLLVNAEQAILEGRGHGTIRVRTMRRGAARLAFEVSDDGPGIDPRILSRIFDPFFTTKAPGVGTGLGLSIAYGIVQQHSGEISVESVSGRGTTFRVELPLVEAEQRLFSERGAAPSAPSPLAGRGRRILVVEDEPTVAKLIGEVLEEEGHVVEAVLDSQEGLSRLARGKYDLVICDLRMPRLDGQAFHRALVSSGSGLDKRLLFVTGDTLSPRTRAFLEQSTVPCLPKPFLVEELKLAVNRLLEPAREAGGPARPATARLHRASNG
jgi:signal transduction histidine kinase/CheY-like chemotaxis protein